MMMTHKTNRLWQLFALVAIAGTTLSLPSLLPADGPSILECNMNATCPVLEDGPATCADGRQVGAPTDCNNLCQNPSQDVGKRCATFDENLCVEAVCGGAGECGNAQFYVPPSCDDDNDCTVDTCDACRDNCSGACVHALDPTVVTSSPVTCADGRQVGAPTDCNNLCQNPSQDVGKRCATFDENLCVEAVCGGAGECGNAQPYVPASCDDADTCTIDTCEVCANDRSGACVLRQDINTPSCNRAAGEPCSTGTQCASTFCADEVCCNRACDNSVETCNLPGRVGECFASAPAPLLSGRGVMIIACLLVGIGLFGLWRTAKSSLLQ